MDFADVETLSTRDFCWMLKMSSFHYKRLITDFIRHKRKTMSSEELEELCKLERQAHEDIDLDLIF